MIICCGENLIDMVPAETGEKTPYGSFRVAPGGCPYNSAIAAARLGADVQFLGAMASDFLGDKLFSRLAENKVGTDLLVRADRPVLLAFVEKNAAGEARYAFYAEGAADRSLSWADIPPALPPEARFLLAGSISIVMEPEAGTILRLVEREKDRLIVSFDPNIRPSLIPDRDAYLKKFEAFCGASGIVKASDTDLEWLYGSLPEEEIVSKILGFGPALVFVTKGGNGSAAYTRTAKASLPAFAVKVVDTIGAGDTFHAAVLAALDRKGADSREKLAGLKAADLEALLRFAAAAAALNCTKEGANPPTLAELERAYPGCGL